MTPDEAAETLINGNVTDFKEWAKRAKKPQLLEALVSFKEMDGRTWEFAIEYFGRLLR